MAPISSPRDAVGVCLLGDKLYAVGGYDGQQYLNEVECYDPQLNEWTKVSLYIISQYQLYFMVVNLCNENNGKPGSGS